MTDPQQSTVDPIFRPMSPPKRQATQGKPSILSSPHPRTSSHLRKHRTSVPSRPQKLPGALIRTKSAPQTLPQLQPQPLPSLRTPSQTHIHIHTPDTSPTRPSLRTHTPSPPQIRMQFPDRSDSATQSDTNKQATRRELHAKLQYLRPLAGPVATPYGGHRAQAATHPDR